MRFKVPFSMLLFLIYYGLVSGGQNGIFSFAACCFLACFLLLIYSIFPKIADNWFVVDLVYEVIPRRYAIFKRRVFFLFFIFSIVFIFKLYTEWSTNSDTFYIKLSVWASYYFCEYRSFSIGRLIDSYLEVPGSLTKIVNRIFYWASVLFCIVWLLKSYFSKGLPESGSK